jgi:23S rRNA (guanosine2251-2'-O)-methyltransferase
MKNHNRKQQNTKNKIESRSRRSQQSDGNPNELWLCGKHPIFTILQKKRRKIFEILATRNTISELENFLKKNSLTSLKPLIKVVDNDHIESLLGKNQLHQGFAIRAAKLPTKNQNDLLEELCTAEEGSKLPTLLLLDQISDPHNIGAIIRSAASFGVTKIIFSEHNSPKENATIVKSSAGTIELVDLIIVTNFNNLIEKLKKIGYWCIGLAGEGAASITAIKEYKNIALIIGSEGDGIRDLVKKNCDLLARIEIDQEVESLNASVAAAIALYEISRR